MRKKAEVGHNNAFHEASDHVLFSVQEAADFTADRKGTIRREEKEVRANCADLRTSNAARTKWDKHMLGLFCQFH